VQRAIARPSEVQRDLDPERDRAHASSPEVASVPVYVDRDPDDADDLKELAEP
jgi:hypothetical protein